MRRWIFLTLAACVAVLPAVFGIAGNATLSQSVPAMVPVGAQALSTPTPDDHGGERMAAEPTTTTSTTTTTTASASTDDHGRGVEPGDDSGGHGGSGSGKGSGRG